MEKNKRKTIAVISIILIFVIVMIVFPILPKLDITTSNDRAYRFCENNNMVLDIVRNNRYYFRCVMIEKNIIINERNISYVEGIQDWAFSDKINDMLQSKD